MDKKQKDRIKKWLHIAQYMGVRKVKTLAQETRYTPMAVRLIIGQLSNAGVGINYFGVARAYCHSTLAQVIRHLVKNKPEIFQ